MISDLETNMVSVERIKEYSETDSEVAFFHLSKYHYFAAAASHLQTQCIEGLWMKCKNAVELTLISFVSIL